LHDHADVDWDLEDSTSVASPSESSAAQDYSAADSASSIGYGAFSLVRHRSKDEKVPCEKDSDELAVDKSIQSVQNQSITETAWEGAIAEEDKDVIDHVSPACVPETMAKRGSSWERNLQN
jgi:hypothetical protein